MSAVVDLYSEMFGAYLAASLVQIKYTRPSYTIIYE